MMETLPLLDRLVSSFGTLDGDLYECNVPELLRGGPANNEGWSHWQPVRVATPTQALSDIYQSIPGPFPPLFEQLLLSYRWLEVELKWLRLRPNPPGPDLSGFRDSVLEDKGLTDYLIPRRLVPFGKGPYYDYDPVCFDLSHRRADGECPILRLDHEDIFDDIEPVKSSVLAPSFEELVVALVKLAPTEK